MFKALFAYLGALVYLISIPVFIGLAWLLLLGMDWVSVMAVIRLLLLQAVDLIVRLVTWWPWSVWETIVVALLSYIALVIRACAGLILDFIGQTVAETGSSLVGRMREIERLLGQIEKRTADLDRNVDRSTDKVASIDQRLEGRGW